MDLQQSFNWPTSQSVNAAYDYAVDFWQRSLLYADVMRERGNQYLEHLAQVTPHVLSFEAEIVMFGNSLERPVNYGLARIIPPEGVEIDPRNAPLSWWIRELGTALASAASRLTARLAPPSGPAIPATSSDSSRTRCQARRSRTSCGPRPPSWNR